MSNGWEVPANPTEAKAWRIADYRRLTVQALDLIHREQCQRLASGRIEERAIVSRWAEVHAVVDTLSVTTREIETVLMERRDEW